MLKMHFFFFFFPIKRGCEFFANSIVSRFKQYEKQERLMIYNMELKNIELFYSQKRSMQNCKCSTLLSVFGCIFNNYNFNRVLNVIKMIWYCSVNECTTWKFLNYIIICIFKITRWNNCFAFQLVNMNQLIKW